MAFLIFFTLLIVEIGFTVSELIKRPLKKEWGYKRLILCVVELALLFILLLPGMRESIRYIGLAVLLVIRALIALSLFLYNRKNEKQKKSVAIVLSCIAGIIFFAISMFPAFIIRDYKGRQATGEYEYAEVSAILIDENRHEYFEHDGSFREVPIHFYFPQNIDEFQKDTLPLIIFSHGAFGYYQSNSSTYMELASHGYVVVSLDHPYHSFFTKDTSGKTITVDPEFFSTALSVGSSDVPEAEIYDITSKWMDLRIADMNFVIDEIERACNGNTSTKIWFFDDKDTELITSVLNAIDIDKIGLMGHSLGGATAVTVGRRPDISAVIDIDGTMLGEETGVENGVVLINEEPYENPLLAIANEEHHRQEMEAMENSYAYANNIVMQNAICGYETYFRNAGHMNFTDLPLIAPALANFLGTGSVDAGECIDTMNGIILRFYDCYLKNEGEFSVEECY